MSGVSIRLNPLGVTVVAILFLCGFMYFVDVASYFKKTEKNINMRDLLSVCIDVALSGGDRVKKVKQLNGGMKEKVKGKTKEGAKEMLTQGDIQSHRQLVYGLKKVYPSLKIVSEEHEEGDFDMRSIKTPSKLITELESLPESASEVTVPIDDIVVWVDPLDATQEYTEDLVNFVTVMVCVAVKGEPVMGVIYTPFGDEDTAEVVWGWADYGFSQNLKPAKDIVKNEKDPNTVIRSRSHSGDVDTVVKAALGENTVIVEAGGSGYKTLQVIKGNADAYVHTTNIKKWDICAGNAILKAVKGTMTTLQGDIITYDEIDKPLNTGGILSTLKNHDFLLKSLKKEFDARKV